MKFSYPPCRINPTTEKPYPKHKWIIPTIDVNGVKQPKTRYEDDGYRLVYHVICDRCKIRDPNPPEY